MCVYVRSNLLIRIFRSGPHVFALLMLFHCMICYTMWLLCILPFGMLCLSAIRMMFVKVMLVGLSKGEFCPGRVLEVGKCSSVLFQSVVCSHVVCW